MTDDVADGERLAREFLEKCVCENITGVGLLNALGNMFVSFYCSHHFETHTDRMTGLDEFSAHLRKEVDAAATERGGGK